MHKALIVGAGQIASGFDAPQDVAIRTHAHAYVRHPDFELVGFYDVDFAKCEAAARKWGCRAFRTLDEVDVADVVSICVPDRYHVRTALEVAETIRPKLIFMEKPVARTLAELERLKATGVSFLVNYSRRYSHVFQRLARRIGTGEFGSFKVGTGYYGKGFRHNGSHMVDLLRFLVGEIGHVTELGRIVDWSEDDPTKTVSIDFAAGGEVILQACDSRNFTIFELDLIFEKARLRIVDAGYRMEIFAARPDDRYAGYVRLMPAESEAVDMDRVMYNAIDHIDRLLLNSGAERPVCTLEDGWEAVKYG